MVTKVDVSVEIPPKSVQSQIGNAVRCQISAQHDPSPRTISIKVLEGHSIEIEELASTDEKFGLQLKTITKGQEYEITITPENTENAGLGILKIKTDSELPRYKNTQAYLLIKKQPD